MYSQEQIAHIANIERQCQVSYPDKEREDIRKELSEEYTPQFDITNVMNEEYITKSEAIEAVCNAMELFLSEYREIENAINRIAAADVMKVVRCRECVHWKPTGSKAGNSFSDMEYIGGCEFTKYCRRESDFCSYGERKGGAD